MNAAITLCSHQLKSVNIQAEFQQLTSCVWTCLYLTAEPLANLSLFLPVDKARDLVDKLNNVLPSLDAEGVCFDDCVTERPALV